MEESEKQVSVNRVPLECEVSRPLRDAERLIGLSLSRLSDLGPGGIKAWPGAWGEYKRLAQLMVKTRALADCIEERELYRNRRGG
jgi:hypothetical protein